MPRGAIALPILVVLVVALAGCPSREREGTQSEPPPPPVAEIRVPPALAATPVGAFTDAAPSPSEETPRVTAERYRENGQLWLARLVLEKTALSASAEESDVVLLATICTEQGDATCVTACEEKLGRPLGADAGAATPKAKPKPVRSRARGR